MKQTREEVSRRRLDGVARGVLCHKVNHLFIPWMSAEYPVDAGDTESNRTWLL